MAKKIKRRKPVLFFCEGQSERSYAKFLGVLADKEGVSYAINAELCRNTGGGDLLSLMQGIEKKLAQLSRRGNIPTQKFLLLDTDINAIGTQRHSDGIGLATHLGVHIIWQKEDHEGFLLRHYAGHGAHNHNITQANRLLLRLMAGYSKPVNASFLGNKLTVGHVRKASRAVTSFEQFFVKIGWTI